jgi:hypothetical protein
MSKFTIGIGGFVAGVCVALLFNNPPIMVSANQGGIVLRGAIPEVAPLENFPAIEKGHVIKSIQQLDGLNCVDCTFDDASLTYGGGPFRFVNAKFSGATNLTFAGAAANTLALLRLLEAVPRSTAPTPYPPNEPINRTSVAPKQPVPKIDFTPPFIGPQR